MTRGELIVEYKPNFPKSLAEFKSLVAERLFNIDKVNDEICASVIEKVNNKTFDFTEEEIHIMREISFIGNVCGCDDDHRIGEDKKNCQFSHV